MSTPMYVHTAPRALYEELGRDGASFASLARTYLKGATQALAKWHAACTRGAPAELAALCHEMRGTAVLLGAACLGAQLVECQHHTAAGSMPPPALCDAIATELAFVKLEMQRALTEFGDTARRNAPRVLVADDSEISRALLCLQLGRAGCSADQAADGQAALAAMHDHDYDLVFMDVEMPVLGGHDASAAWRQHERTSGGRVCILGLSAHGPEAAGDWRAAGMDTMLRKPMTAATLAALLEQWIGWPGANAAAPPS